MPQNTKTVSVGIGATVNVLSGTLFERVGGRGARIRVYAAGTSSGYAFGELTGTFIVGSDVMFQDAGIPANANGVSTQDNQLGSGTALPGDQLTFNVTSSSAGAENITFIIDIENL